MKNIFLLCTLIIITFTTKAQGFEPYVIIDPPHPMVGDTIRVGIAHTYYPGCLSLPSANSQGLTHLFQYFGNDIRLIAVNNTFNPPICFPIPLPAIRAYYELGQLAEGAYTLETLISGSVTLLPIPEPPYNLAYAYGPTFAFEVKAAVVVDTLSTKSIIIYALILLILTYIFTRHYFITRNKQQEMPHHEKIPTIFTFFANKCHFINLLYRNIQRWQCTIIKCNYSRWLTFSTTANLYTTGI